MTAAVEIQTPWARPFLINLSVAFLVVSPLFASQEGLAGVDSSVLEAAALVLEAAPEDSDWDGFTGPAEFAVCTVDGGTLYALSEPPQDSAGLVSLASAGFEGLYYSSGRPGPLRQQCFHLDFVFEGRRILSFPQIDSIYSVNEPAEALATALFHEEFHRFQGNAFGLISSPDGRDLHVLERSTPFPEALITSSRFRHLASQERRLLAEAIGASDTAEVRRRTRDYVTLRRRRLEDVPEEVREGEAHVEWKEGTAHLASYSLVTRVAAKPASRTADLVRNDLLSTPAFDEEPRRFRHWHIYATGAAIGLVMDKLGVSWRREVQEGETLFSRLITILEMSDAGSRCLTSVRSKRGSG